MILALMALKADSTGNF